MVGTSAFAYDACIDGICYNLTGDEAEVTFFSENGNGENFIGDVVIPGSITYNNKNYAVTSIGDHAFIDCFQMTSVTIPSTVLSIGNLAFDGCTALTHVTIPSSVTSVGDFAFYGCSNIISFEISDNLTTVNVTSFRETQWYYDQPDGIVYLGRICLGYKGNVQEENIVLRDNTLAIARHAFARYKEITSITIPSKVIAIGDCAFEGNYLSKISVEEGNTVYDSRDNCNAIIESSTNKLLFGCKSTTIPNSVTSIGDRAFADVYYLTSLTIPNSVKSIGECAFFNCSRWASSITLNNVESIGEGAFGYCRELSSISLSDNITNIEGSAFIGCSKLTSITIPKKIKVLNDHVFGLCKSLKSIIIPEGVTTIGICAFDGCSNLESISLPMSLARIETCAFRECTSMSNISIYAKIPPVCGTDALLDINKQNCKLEIPAGCTNVYKAADQWKEFFDINEFTSNILEQKSNLSYHDIQKIKIYGMNGFKLKEIKKGLNIINGKIYINK